eukprot:CAMPEP_0197021024 /NCGR_PEP_ID=MMETSP1384-20130603/1914_1 /TAXON_ID=29189 /ORGANISM="Ammonia sp." /LENGTH=52 /DNA_ID=CAMNT_0042448769 /DNA_START=101 /DNA_END=255 /DNA_ORIENTATION=+
MRLLSSSSRRCFATASKSTPAIRKTTQLRALLQSQELEFIMEAHNGMSAIIS